MTHPDPLQIAIEAARAAGTIAIEAYTGARTVTAKGINDFATEVDIAAEEAIVSLLSAAFPEDAVLAEERGSSTGSSRYRWIIDPLDGTHNYAAQLPLWCVSIARMDSETGLPDVAVVYDPLHNELYTAKAGLGCWLNGQEIRVSVVDTLKQAIVACDLGYAEPQSERTMDVTVHVRGRIRRLRVLGSAVLALAYVACGRLDAFYHTHLMPWDLAAGWLILTEAGGVCTTWNGGPVRIENGEVAATNGLIHQELIEVLSAEAPHA